MFRVTIEEVTTTMPPQRDDNGNVVSGETIIERFRQTVDALDVPRIVALINTKPRQRRTTRKAAAS